MKKKISGIMFPIITSFMVGVLFLYFMGTILFFADSHHLMGIRKERATIVEVNNNYYIAETKDGNLWSFYSDRTFFPHDTVLLTFDTKDTSDIYDDEVTSVK